MDIRLQRRMHGLHDDIGGKERELRRVDDRGAQRGLAERSIRAEEDAGGASRGSAEDLHERVVARDVRVARQPHALFERSRCPVRSWHLGCRRLQHGERGHERDGDHHEQRARARCRPACGVRSRQGRRGRGGLRPCHSRRPGRGGLRDGGPAVRAHRARGRAAPWRPARAVRHLRDERHRVLRRGRDLVARDHRRPPLDRQACPTMPT